ncbi:MAG: PSD1 domain-containing protein [Planctomycetaceae bacterium]|nr:PSD1 domain-containing protein [Planctomycetaceae bacterium]
MAVIMGLLPSPFAGAADKSDIAVRFERDIEPIFASRCLKCHGNDGGEGGLRLTDLSHASARLESGRQAIVPRTPDASELLRRVTSKNDDDRMPPTGAALTAAEVDKLKQWIAAGAEWPAHWAYRPLTRSAIPPAPAPHAAWPRNAVDHFVLERLVEKGLAPAPEADRRTLLRRVTFDLTGLPPTPDELDAFIADAAPDAWERVVDRLLASPQYGERWARHWMDIVHYAETHGHDQDRPRENAWPYRDYLIRSLNDDKPYATFVEDQIAGDVLHPHNPHAIAATGFLATGAWDESSLKDIQENTLDREIARYLDRDDIVTTVMSTFVSSTVHCARCHDHKFDPISQRDYYALQAVFAGTDKADRPYDPDPAVGAKRRDLTARIAQVSAMRQRRDPSLLEEPLRDEIAAWEAAIRKSATVWRAVNATTFTSSGGATLSKLEDGSIFSGGTRPERDTVTIVAPTELKAITGVRLEVLTDDRLMHKGPGRQDNGNLHLNEFAVFAAPRDNPAARQKLTLVAPRADFNQQGWSIDLALDGNPATAWGIYPEVGKPHHAVFELKDAPRSDSGWLLTFELQQIHGGGHLIGRTRLLVTDAPLPWPFEAQPLPPEVTAVLAVPPGDRNEDQQVTLAAAYLEMKWKRELDGLPKPQHIYCGTNSFEPIGSFRPSKTPRPIHLLQRGDITKPGAMIEPGTLACVPGLESHFTLTDATNEGERRAALARWTSDSRNVLTWRSIANRVWQYHFGKGLVDSPNDFGRMGASPSHPELLDWLALELQSTGSLKSLHRLLVSSATYRQQSRHDDRAAAIDADNRYLWRMNRQRLDAESLRDAVLAVAGTLDTRMGGPSVRQFIQTPGIHVTPNVDYQNFAIDDPANHRRSVYRFIFRTIPDPFMDALDCPDASQLTPKRNVSLTALQALALWNDKFVVRQCERMAASLVPEPADPAAQVDTVIRRIFGRAPTEKERQFLPGYAAKHGWANACRVLINSNEFVFID